jgi:cysteine desulfurase
MTASRLYLDYNASAPVRTEVAEAIARALMLPGNPSSVHTEGRAARSAIETARAQVAALAGALPRDVIFTAGGTEAANAILNAGLRREHDKRENSRLLMGAGEHLCVLKGHRFAADKAETIPLLDDGTADLSWLANRLADLRQSEPQTRFLVSLQAANNETGIVQPLQEAGRLVHAADGLLHCDAVQAAGRLSVALSDLGADAASLSAHKIGGPKGIGAIVLAPGVLMKPLVRGGGHESSRRAGTHDLAGIVGFGVAAELAMKDAASETARLQTLRDELEGRLSALHPDVRFAGVGAARLPNTSLVMCAGVKSHTALMALDLAGIAVSAGSACSSGKVGRSHVLDAMRVPPEWADSAVRVSLGRDTSPSDVIRFVSAYAKVVGAAISKSSAA